jgi:hypothetical protein
VSLLGNTAEEKKTVTEKSTAAFLMICHAVPDIYAFIESL